MQLTWQKPVGQLAPGTDEFQALSDTHLLQAIFVYGHGWSGRYTELGTFEAVNFSLDADQEIEAMHQVEKAYDAAVDDKASA